MGPTVVPLAEARRLMEASRKPGGDASHGAGDDSQSSHQSTRQRHGAQWEAIVETHLARLVSKQRVSWWRTPQPHRVVGKAREGLVIVYTEAGPPDYVLLVEGVAIAADAKSCITERWPLGSLEEHQAKKFDEVGGQKGIAAIFLLLGGRGWVIPWTALRPRWWGWFTTSSRAEAGTASLSVADVAAMGWELDSTGQWLSRLKEA